MPSFVNVMNQVNTTLPLDEGSQFKWKVVINVYPLFPKLIYTNPRGEAMDESDKRVIRKINFVNIYLSNSYLSILGIFGEMMA